MRILFMAAFSLVFITAQGQNLTPEMLWKLGRVSAVGISKDRLNVVYTVSTPAVELNKSNKKTYLISLDGGLAKEIADSNSYVTNDRLSPDGKSLLTIADVKLRKVFGKDYYPELSKSDVQIYDELGYRHWDEWEDGAFSHVFITPVSSSKPGQGIDIMSGMPFDCPQKPHGDNEDYIWGPDGKSVVYVTKEKVGKAYALSTNTDIFEYNLAANKTVNLSQGMQGYDVNPEFSSEGKLAWLSMKREGYEADKQDIVVREGSTIKNLTQFWDNSVQSFKWSSDGRSIYFTAAIDGTLQLFNVDNPGLTAKVPDIKQITNGDFDVNAIVGQVGNRLIVSRTDMNHAVELYIVDLQNGSMKQLTHVNDDAYQKISSSKFSRRYVTTTDGKRMLVWVIYPPGFDSTKKYPALLYCQGGPQSPLTQSYSFRWNFSLMAAGGYIVIAPNRRGMYGHGRDWNEQISKDCGGQVMKDYLSAVDDVSKAAYVDKSRIGCVGASYGGYSSFYLAGIHNNRFKTFIAHDGVFDLRSMSGTTEELWFTNWENGGYYWDKNNKAAQKTFSEFNPADLVARWNKPILVIQGGKDFRVPIEQGLQAFQVAQLRGLKSRLLYFPEENHWVLKPQNAIVWQREFYRWLKETL
ncbi:S9 family peptidase [Segetibacter sp. 3557_3]|uniref:S9 family peptidase n=1 Tax=Segetibacter sp. 3557_3 TaxID=2547429 RepID=UPI001058FEBA|nr:S9 family peptidase [Segetibacter sp. 3557_3]TDH28841.1 S9 family peptidase [Segetibacter sp. 3557_3]